jgi:hypothetical protein
MTTEQIPPCAASMGCLCAGHARGQPADAPCDTAELNGRDDALMGKTLQLPPCGCTIEGAGTLPDPVRIVFCRVHASCR